MCAQKVDALLCCLPPGGNVCSLDIASVSHLLEDAGNLGAVSCYAAKKLDPCLVSISSATRCDSVDLVINGGIKARHFLIDAAKARIFEDGDALGKRGCGCAASEAALHNRVLDAAGDGCDGSRRLLLIKRWDIRWVCVEQLDLCIAKALSQLVFCFFELTGALCFQRLLEPG